MIKLKFYTLVTASLTLVILSHSKGMETSKVGDQSTTRLCPYLFPDQKTPNYLMDVLTTIYGNPSQVSSRVRDLYAYAKMNIVNYQQVFGSLVVPSYNLETQKNEFLKSAMRSAIRALSIACALNYDPIVYSVLISINKVSDYVKALQVLETRINKRLYETAIAELNQVVLWRTNIAFRNQMIEDLKKAALLFIKSIDLIRRSGGLLDPERYGNALKILDGLVRVGVKEESKELEDAIKAYKSVIDDEAFIAARALVDAIDGLHGKLIIKEEPFWKNGVFQFEAIEKMYETVKNQLTEKNNNILLTWIEKYRAFTSKDGDKSIELDSNTKIQAIIARLRDATQKLKESNKLGIISPDDLESMKQVVEELVQDVEPKFFGEYLQAYKEYEAQEMSNK
jgi:hypothetical protein